MILINGSLKNASHKDHSNSFSARAEYNLNNSTAVSQSSISDLSKRTSNESILLSFFSFAICSNMASGSKANAGLSGLTEEKSNFGFSDSSHSSGSSISSINS